MTRSPKVKDFRNPEMTKSPKIKDFRNPEMTKSPKIKDFRNPEMTKSPKIKDFQIPSPALFLAAPDPLVSFSGQDIKKKTCDFKTWISRLLTWISRVFPDGWPDVRRG